MKGINVLLSSVMLVLITITASILISGWLSTTAETQTDIVRNSTQAQLQCQFADIYISSAIYDCNNDCSAGVNHTTNVTVVNSGKKSVSFDKIFIINTTGDTVAMALNETKTLNVGDTITVQNVTADSCSGINSTIEFVTVSTTTCPTTAYDNFEGGSVTYSNC